VVEWLGYKPDGLEFNCWQKQEIFLFSKNIQTGSGAHPAPNPVGSGVPSLGAEQSGDHPLLSSAEVKNEWSYTTAHPICLHGVDRDNFTSVTIEKVMWLYNPWVLAMVPQGSTDHSLISTGILMMLKSNQCD